MDTDRDPFERVAESFLERLRRGERPTIEEYAEKYPELADDIRELLPALIHVEGLAPSSDDHPAVAAATNAEGEHLKELGEYRILREIGRGGMGCVFEAEQVSLGRRVALKVLPSSNLMSTKSVERFRREARAAAGLEHDHIVPVYGVGEDHGVHYYVMQFIQGTPLDAVIHDVKMMRTTRNGDSSVAEKCEAASLSSRLASWMESQESASVFEADPASEAHSNHSTEQGSVRGSSSAALMVGDIDASGDTGVRRHTYYRRIAQIGLEVAQALSYAHGEGILHRDIKPANLLLDLRGKVWITDFGLAKIEEGEGLTQSGDLLGTLPYMPRERLEGWSDPRSDIYSLGLTLYECLTLRRAFEDTDRHRLTRRIMDEEPVRPRQIERGVPADLETIVLKMMEKEPGDRYATADQVANDLEAFLSDRPIRARPTSRLEKTWRWCRRNRTVASLGGVAALLLTIAVVATLFAMAVNEKRRIVEQAELKTRVVSHISEARAKRLGDEAGRRYEGLELVQEAAALLRELDLSPEEHATRALELRNEAVAYSSLVDVQVERKWKEPAGDHKRAVVIDPNFRVYATENKDRLVCIRQLRDGHQVIQLPERRPGRLRFTPDGELLAVEHSDGQMRIWDWEKQRLVFSVQGTYGRPSTFSPDGQRVIVFVKKERLQSAHQLFDLHTGQMLKEIPSGQGQKYIRRVRFQPAGDALLFVYDKGIELRNLESGETLWERSADRILSADWNPDGTLLATGHPTSVQVRDGESGEVLATSDTLSNADQVAFSPTGEYLASTQQNRTIDLWDLRVADPSAAALKLNQLLTIPASQVPQIAFSRDGAFLGSSVTGGEITYWKAFLKRGFRLARCEWEVFRSGGIREEVKDIHVHNEGRLLATATSRGVRVWDLELGQHLAFLPLGRTEAVLFEPREGHLLTSGKAGLWRWPIVTQDAGDARTVRLGPPKPLRSGSFFGHAEMNEDGRILAAHHSRVEDVSSTGARLVRWHIDLLDIDTGNVRSFGLSDRGSAQEVEIAISPNGRWIAVAPQRGWAVKVWEVSTEKIECVWEYRVRVGKVRFSPDGKWLAVGTGKENFLLEVGTWERKWHLERREDSGELPGPLAFSQDGSMLALAPSPRVTKIVDTITGAEIVTLGPPTLPLCFTADGRFLVSAGAFELKIWELQEVREDLRTMNLDWVVRPFPPAREPSRTKPLRVDVTLGQLEERRGAPVVTVAEAPRALRVEETLETLSSTERPPVTGTSVVRNLGTTHVRHEGDWIAYSVWETFAGEDLNGDGDTEDAVLCILNLRKGDTTQLRLVGDVLGFAGDWLLLRVSESQQGEDLNGDGDRDDEVFHVHDLASGKTSNLELASWPQDEAWRSCSFSVDWFVFRVAERHQGKDLNGDGDMEDAVIHAYHFKTGETTKLGLDGSRFSVSGDWFLLRVSERSEGKDLNGDGDSKDGFVVHVHNFETGATRNLGLAASPHVGRCSFYGDWLVIWVTEKDHGKDLNGNGLVVDTEGETDVAVYLHKLSSGETTNLHTSSARLHEKWLIYSNHILNLETGKTTDLPGEMGGVFGNWFVFLVPESSLGNDCTGDGHTLDAVVHTHNFASGETKNLGFVAPRGWSWKWSLSVYGDWLVCGDFAVDLQIYNLSTGQSRNVGLPGRAMTVAANCVIFLHREAFFGKDLNGDGDARDSIVHMHDLDAGVTTNLGLAGSVARLCGSKLVVEVREKEQDRDLNGDGDMNDIVPLFHDLSSGRAANSERAENSKSRGSASECRRLSWFVEKVQGKDLNGDGDLEDVFARVQDFERDRSTNLAARSATLEENRLVFAVWETLASEDLNGDGDLLDQVIQVHDFETGRSTNLGLALPTLVSRNGNWTVSGDWLLARVPENEQGGDLNGDGDRGDTIVHLVDLRAFGALSR